MPLTRSVSVYENQRYSPVSGFSAKGLLIGDRGAFSNEEGTSSWNSLEEASPALLSPGWEYTPNEDWKVHIDANDTDAEGWSYASNFGANVKWVATRTMSCFVRRKQHIHDQIFRGYCISYFPP